jgi:hypothetical protein
MRMALSAFLVLLACACRDGEDIAVPTQTPSPLFVLRLHTSPGVITNLAPADSMRRAGSVVTYTFALAPGYTSLRVLLDGQPTSPSGEVTMDRSRAFWASADPIALLAQAESALVATIERSVLHDTPQEFYRQLEGLVDSLLASSTPETTLQTLGRAIAVAVVPERDADKVAAAFKVGPAPTSMPGASAGRLRAVTGPHTVLVFVNGIMTTTADYRLAWRGALYPLAQREGLTITRGFEVTGFYNRTAVLPDAASEKFWSCVVLKWNQLAYGFLFPSTTFPLCLPAGGLVIAGRAVADVAQAIAQMTNIVVFGSPSLVQSEARDLASLIIQARVSGQRVILVAHSQGNLMVGEALLYLDSLSSWSPDDSACLGWIAIAPPVPPRTPQGMAAPVTMILRGAHTADILELLLGLSSQGVVPVQNELSDAYDGQGWFWSRLLGWFGVGTGGALHSVVSSYFGMPATEARIGGALRDQVDLLDARCTAPTATLVVTSNMSTSWTVGPGGLTGTGVSGIFAVRAERNGTRFDVRPDQIAGHTVTVATAEGPGSSMLMFPGETKSFHITYSSPSTELLNGVSRAGAISSPGETDLLTFLAAEGDAIAVGIGKIGALSTLWPWIRLVSPSGSLLGEAMGPDAAQISDRLHRPISAPESGLYTLMVGSWDGSVNGYSGTGTYVLTLAKVPGSFVVPPGDEGGTLSEGGDHAGIITVGDMDLWTFWAEQGQSLPITITRSNPASTLWPWVRLLGPMGEFLGEASGRDVARVVDRLFRPLTASTTGLYTVIVGSWDGSVNGYGGTGDYVITRRP